MVRKLAIAAFTVSALSTGVANALGLGEANVESALNQPLSAEIELVNVRDLEQNEILTNLANRKEFLRAGVDRAFFLSDLRFAVVEKADGKPVIKITSSKVVREPFLNFLVEVTWPSGRLLREYSLLIDPPTFSSESTQPVQLTQAPTTSSQPESMTQARASAATTSTSTSGDSYGPTGSDDTLWSIAIKTRPDQEVSPQQQMLAIQDLNPDAFLNENINRLKMGQILRLPSKEQIESRTSREAIAAVSAQNRSVSEISKVQSRGLDATSPKGESSAATSGTAQDKLRVIVGNADEAGADAAISGRTAGGSGAATSEELAIAKERLDKSTRENEELKSRLENLEGQLDTLQRLISLKDDQLAEMQESAEEMPPALPDSEMEGDDEATVATDKPTPVQQEPQEESFFDMIKNNVVYQIALGVGGVILLLVFWLLSRSKVQKEEVYHKDFEAVDDNETVIAFDPVDKQEKPIAAGSAGSDPIAEAGVYVAYKKYDQAAQVLESALDDEPDNHEYRLKLMEVVGEAKDAAKFAGAFAALEASGDASILERASKLKSRFANLSDEPNVSLDDLENQLMSGDNFASDAEIAESDISEDFELDVDISDADEFEDTVIKSEAQAEFVQAEGFDLDKESAVTNEDNLDIEFDLNDIDLEEGVGDETVIQGARESREEGDDFVSLDFDLDSVSDAEDELDIEIDEDDLETTMEMKPKEIEDIAEEENLAFDSDFDLEETTEESTELDLDSGFSDELMDIESSAEPASSASVQESVMEDELNLDLDESDIDFSLDEQAAMNLDKEEEANELAEDLAEGFVQEVDSIKDDNLALEAGLSGLEGELPVEDADVVDTSAEEEDIVTPSPASMVTDEFVTEMEEDFDFLSDTDESTTKLDLAKAYIDMGDMEGARDILDEVVEDGSADQRQEASELLKGLD